MRPPQSISELMVCHSVCIASLSSRALDASSVSGITISSHLTACVSVEQLSNVGSHIHSLQSPLEALRVYANRKCRHPGQGPIVFHTLWRALPAKCKAHIDDQTRGQSSICKHLSKSIVPKSVLVKQMKGWTLTSDVPGSGMICKQVS